MMTLEMHHKVHLVRLCCVSLDRASFAIDHYTLMNIFYAFVTLELRRIIGHHHASCVDNNIILTSSVINCTASG